MREGLHELMDEDGLEHSARTSQAIRRRADILIDRADALQGGLSSVLRLIMACRDQSLRTCSFFRYLLAAQIPVLAVVILAVAFGRGLINGAQILYCGTLAEIAGLWYLLRLPIKKNRLQKPTPVQKYVEESILTDKKLCLPPAFASVITAIYALILTLFGVITGESCAAFWFFPCY